MAIVIAFTSLRRDLARSLKLGFGRHWDKTRSKKDTFEPEKQIQILIWQVVIKNILQSYSTVLFYCIDQRSLLINCDKTSSNCLINIGVAVGSNCTSNKINKPTLYWQWLMLVDGWLVCSQTQIPTEDQGRSYLKSCCYFYTQLNFFSLLESSHLHITTFVWRISKPALFSVEKYQTNKYQELLF